MINLVKNIQFIVMMTWLYFLGFSYNNKILSSHSFQTRYIKKESCIKNHNDFAIF